ncbi:MAG: hypothetical protein Q8P85_10060 [Pseudomonas sp.]|nr:hypothetical protein [Pseudomonas sp.]
MTLSEIRRSAIEPALLLLPARMTSPQAEVMLLAIGLQESRFTHRRQVKGPARSYWQAERGGGMVHGVLRHPLTRDIAVTVCDARDVQPVNEAVHVAIEHDDVLAAALARLLLWTDPFALPELGDEHGAWDLYLRTWRPGKPHRQTWDALYAQALAAVTA